MSKRKSPKPIGQEITQRLYREQFPLAEVSHFRTRAWRDGVAQSAGELKPLFPSVLHALVNAARNTKRRGITLVGDDGVTETHRTYGELLEGARTLAARMAGEGVVPGDPVLIVLPTGFEFVEAYFAAQLVRAVPIPAYPPAALERAKPSIERLCLIGNHAKATLCITDSQLYPLLGEVRGNVSSLRNLVTVEAMHAEDGPKADFSGAPEPDDLAFIQYTSGSTGDPKGVALTHTNLVSNIHSIGQIGKVGKSDVSVSWLPLYHDMGLIGALLFPIYWRLPIVLMSPLTFLMHPEAWLWAIHRHKGTISASPNFGYARVTKRVRDSDCVGLDLSSWRISLNGAEPVSLKTVRDFEAKLGPNGYKSTTMLPAYGLAEISVAAAFPDPRDEVEWETVDREMLAEGRAVLSEGDNTITLVAVGRAVPGHEIIIVGDDGKPLEEHEVGHILLRGPSVMQGYYNNPTATAAALSDGWLYTGDLGYFSKGQLYVTGRIKDLIITRGKNYHAEDIEHEVERLRSVRPGGVVAFAVYDEKGAGDRVVVVAETRQPEEAVIIEADVKRVAQEACGVRIDTVHLVAPGTIPRTPSGKRQRNLTRKLYLKKELGKNRPSHLSTAKILARSGIGHAKASLRKALKRGTS